LGTAANNSLRLQDWAAARPWYYVSMLYYPRDAEATAEVWECTQTSHGSRAKLLLRWLSGLGSDLQSGTLSCISEAGAAVVCCAAGALRPPFGKTPSGYCQWLGCRV